MLSMLVMMLAAAMPVVRVMMLAAAMPIVLVMMLAMLVMVAAAATALMRRIHFFWSGVAHGKHLAAIAHCLSRQLMVEVHHHLVGGHLLDQAVQSMSLGCHHRHISALVHFLVVELSVDDKYLTVQLMHQLRIFITKSLSRRQSELKLITRFKAAYALDETVEHSIFEPIDEAVGALLIKLEHLSLAIGVDYEYLVGEFNEFSELNFLCH